MTHYVRALCAQLSLSVDSIVEKLNKQMDESEKKHDSWQRTTYPHYNLIEQFDLGQKLNFNFLTACAFPWHVRWCKVEKARHDLWCEQKLNSTLIIVCVYHFFSLSCRFCALQIISVHHIFSLLLHYFPSIRLGLNYAYANSINVLELITKQYSRLINRSVALEERHKWLPSASEVFTVKMKESTSNEQHIDVSHFMPNFWQHPICHFILVTVRAFDMPPHTWMMLMSLAMTQRITRYSWALCECVCVFCM